MFKSRQRIFTHGTLVNLFLELNIWSRDLDTDFTLKDCLFGDAKLTKNADPDKYSYSGYSIGFDSCSLFLILNFDFGKMLFLVQTVTSPKHTDNRIKNVLVLPEGQTQRLDDTTITTEAKYSINFTDQVCITMEETVFCMLMV